MVEHFRTTRPCAAMRTECSGNSTFCRGLLCRHKHVAWCFHMYIYIKIFLFRGSPFQPSCQDWNTWHPRFSSLKASVLLGSWQGERCWY